MNTSLKILMPTRNSQVASLRRRVRTALLGVGVGAMIAQAQATQIGLGPALQTFTPGSVVDLQLQISGLGQGMAPSLGAFDLDVTFDPALLSFDSVTFGDPLLGDLLGPIAGSSTGSSLSSTGEALNLFGVSLDLPDDLNAHQPDQFVLASLRFLVIGDRATTLGLANVLLGDADGSALVPDAIRGASLRPATTVPDQGPALPAMILLVATGVLGRVGGRWSAPGRS